MNDLFSQILLAQSGAPRLFAQQQATPWGALFYNPNNTLSPEANHGAVWRPLDDYTPAFVQTKAFFKPKQLPARLYVYASPDRERAILSAGAAQGGSVTRSPRRLLVFDGAAPAPGPSKLTVAAEPDFDPALRETVLAENLQLESILRGSLQNEGFQLFVGRLFGTPVTMASVWETDAVIRISNVMTGAAFRGCGFGRALMGRVLREAAARGKPAYLFAEDPVAIRLYRRAGMEEQDPGFGLWVWEE